MTSVALRGIGPDALSGSSARNAHLMLLSQAGAWLAIGVGILVLIGWFFDVEVLKSVVPGAVHMKVNTAVGIVVAGWALLLCSGAKRRPIASIHLLGSALVLLGCATLTQYLAGVDFGIDQLLFDDRTRAFNPVPGRMSPFTACAFVLLGAAFLGLGQTGRLGWFVIATCACTIGIGSIAVIGYLWNAVDLVTDNWAPPVALNTGLALIALGAGLVAHQVQQDEQWSADPYSVIGRKLTLAFWGMVLVLVATTSFSYRSNAQFAHAARLVSQTQEVRLGLARLDGCMADAESTQRYYLLAGDPASKASFAHAAAGCRYAHGTVLALIADDSEQVSRALTLALLVPQRLQALETVASVFEQRGLDEARRTPAFASGHRAMREIAAVIEGLDDVEKSRLAQREQARTTDRATMLVSLMLMLLVSTGIVALLVHGMKVEVRKSSELREENVRARELAEAATRTKSAFLANMSHEIRTPMTGVLGMVDLLAQESLSPVQRRYVDAMRASGRHLLNVINDILDFSRTETGKLELEHIDFSLPEILEGLRSMCHPLAVERGLTLTFDINPHSPPIVKGDPMRLKQVLLNLVSNAIKFTDRGSVIVRVSQADADDSSIRLRFEVRDTGQGISAQAMEQLFAPFMQADTSTARRFGGSGLGLAISKRLVEAMGGSIGATSTPGLGSLFYFELPLALGAPENLVRTGAAHATPAPAQRILIAEDVAINRDILRAALTRQGHQITFAEDGVEAVQLIQQQDFDTVLMDVQMPRMDGVEATQRVRRLGGRYADLPIIGLTANVMAQERARYLGAGMNECLMKPIDWDHLNAALTRHAPRTGGATAESQSDLLDMPALQQLRRMIGPDEFATLLEDGMQAYDTYLVSMQQASDGREGIVRDAHKLKGSAGTLGLRAIALAAEAIEAEVGGGNDGKALIAQLRHLMEASRALLVSNRLLSEPHLDEPPIG